MNFSREAKDVFHVATSIENKCVVTCTHALEYRMSDVSPWKQTVEDNVESFFIIKHEKQIGLEFWKIHSNPVHKFVRIYNKLKIRQNCFN